MSGRHRGSTSRRRIVAALLAAAVGRGYVGGHRLADAALGLEPVASPLTAPVGTSSHRAAPRLSVVRAPAPTDTMPHPVVVLLPLARQQALEQDHGDHDEPVPSEPVTIDLRDGADVRAYSARHIA